MTVTFNKAQAEAIRLAWAHVTDYSMSQTVRQCMVEAASMEKRAFNEPIPQMQARAMVLSWFKRGLEKPHMPISDIAGTRMAHLLAVTAGAGVARSEGRVNPLDRAVLDVACLAYTAAQFPQDAEAQAAFRDALAARKAAKVPA